MSHSGQQQAHCPVLPAQCTGRDVNTPLAPCLPCCWGQCPDCDLWVASKHPAPKSSQTTAAPHMPALSCPSTDVAPVGTIPEAPGR